MGRMFYNRIEADYLQKLEVFWLKKKDLLKYYYSTTSIVWKRGDNQASIGIEVALVENLREYLLGQEEPRDGFVRLTYTAGNQKYDYKVQLTTTYCNYGRFRYWFNCPLCSRRVGVLYSRSNYFACRHCNYLTYESKKLNGSQKRVGRIISEKEVESLRNDAKRIFYNGNMTRKMKRYLKAKKKFDAIYSIFLFGKVI